MIRILSEKLVLLLLVLLVIYTMAPSEYMIIPSDWGVAEVRYFIGFHLSLIVYIASTIFMVGRDNKRAAYIFIGCMLTEYVVFTILHSQFGSNLYIRVWMGFISSIPLYLGLRYGDLILETFGQETMPTRFKLLLRKASEYFVLTELFAAIYYTTYAISMSIDKEGSVYDTTIALGHFNYYPFQLSINDALVLYLMFIFIKSTIEEYKDSPDLLFKIK